MTSDGERPTGDRSTPALLYASGLEYPLQDKTLRPSLRRAAIGSHALGRFGLTIREVWMSRKRDVLEELKLDELRAAVDRFELPVVDRRVKGDLVEALAGSRKAGIAAILGDLSRDRLKELWAKIEAPLAQALEARMTEKTKNLQKFLNERSEREVAKIPDVPKDTPVKEIARAAVVGAGTMGGGIAMTYASSGIPVLLKDIDDAALQRGLATIRKNYEITMSKGKMTAAQIEQTLALITPTTSYHGFEQVDIVVEAVFENLDLKKTTFAEVAGVTRADCILASNSSTLDIDEIGRASGRPAQVLGHHFFSPANVMKLLEIVRGRSTSKEAIATSLKLARRLGKVGVVVGNCFGFVANRMLAYYMRESYLLLEEGASVEQIDRVLTEFGLPVGPFAMQDIAGIDVGARIRQYLNSIGKTRAEGPQSDTDVEATAMVVIDHELFRRLPNQIAVYRAGIALLRGDAAGTGRRKSG